MKGTKYISDLITDPNMLKQGLINIIEAPVSSGKTVFALTTVPSWVTSPERILYLIDTSNGEYRLHQNIITASRQNYAFCDYNTKHVWGENDAKNRMPVMTYSGFGSEVRKNNGHFNWSDFDYIICDEMQNLVEYQHFRGDPTNLKVAEAAIRQIVAEGKARIIALSATPQVIKEHFTTMWYCVPFDHSDIITMETFSVIPYKDKVETILSRHCGQTGILYTTQIEDMKRYLKAASHLNIRANGFWSINNDDERMATEQLMLRAQVLQEETIPKDIDLLIINAASETCIKIKSEKRPIDYMIVHDKNEEVKTQVRGRYHGDLPLFYYHDIEDANNYVCRNLPPEFIGKRLYAAEQEELCAHLHLINPKDNTNNYYKMRKTKEYLAVNGFVVSESKKDKARNGAHYVIISRDTSFMGNPIS